MKKAIFDLLSKEIASGLTIDIETINFLESTMGIHDIEAIRTFFMEGSLHDSGLIDLIFYPDLDFRIKAESFIPLMGFKKNEIEDIIGEVKDAVEKISLSIINSDETIIIEPDAYSIECFINSLHLYKKTMAPFKNLSIETLNEKLLLLGRAILRKTKYIKSNKRDDFIFLIIQKMIISDAPEKDFSTQLEFLLKLFGERPDDSIKELLLKKKAHYLQVQNEIIHFEELRTKYSMEILLMQKATPPPMGIDEVNRNLNLIDRVSILGFGKPVLI